MRMAEFDAMKETIKQWREAHKEAPRDFDFKMLCTIIGMLNDSSAVKVACSPLDEDRNWIADTVCHNVGKLDVDDEGRLLISIRGSKEECTVEKFDAQLRRLKKQRIADGSSVMLRLSETRIVKVTDAYSHALVRDSWAGLPFDFVLAYQKEE